MFACTAIMWERFSSGTPIVINPSITYYICGITPAYIFAIATGFLSSFTLLSVSQSIIFFSGNNIASAHIPCLRIIYNFRCYGPSNILATLGASRRMIRAIRFTIQIHAIAHLWRRFSTMFKSATIGFLFCYNTTSSSFTSTISEAGTITSTHFGI